MEPAADALHALWTDAAHDPADLDAMRWSGPRHFLPAVFDVTAAAAASVGAANLAAARFWTARSRERVLPGVAVDSRHAATAFRSERYLHVNGALVHERHPTTRDYETDGGRWIRLHTQLPAHRDIACAVLGVDPDPERIEVVLAGQHAEQVEEAIMAAGGCAAMMRSTEEWRTHPHGAALGDLPTVETSALGEASPLERSAPARPLEGIRVLDLTRIIAGPVCGRFLAACGADVLRVISPHLPDIGSLIIDTGFGKRSAHLDLRQPSDRDRFEALVSEADVLVQGYRPGALAALGYSAERLAELRPGIVVAELSAYGRLGPWAERRGFDSLVQMVSGIAFAGMLAQRIDRPAPLPAQALDHASGYLLAFGVLTALTRRLEQGGSWRVQVSLARTGRWIEDFGHVDALDVPDPTADDVGDLLGDAESPFGALRYVRPAGAIEGAPHEWVLPPSPHGSHAAMWA